MKDCITASDLKEFSESFHADKANLVAMNAVTSKGVQASAREFAAVRSDLHEYSVNLDQHGITWQKNSGRCWMFAGFNVLRAKLIKDLNLDNFTFSGNYLTFYDKLEKANLFLENILENPDEPSDGRLMTSILRGGTGDGGEWEMFVNLVRKYGVVPAKCQPETISTDNSRQMPSVVGEKLRQYARDLRNEMKAGKSAEELRAQKDEMLNTIYRMYAICYGEPVKTFDFQVRTKDGRFINDKGITPIEFFNKYINIDFSKYVSLVAGSTNGAETKKYQFKYNGDVVEGIPVSYVSVTVQDLKDCAIAQLKDGQPIWFGCDVTQSYWRDGGLLDDKMFDYEDLFGTTFGMTKAERFAYGQAHMSHAMTFKGVDLDEDGNPLKWRVENTWGPDVGDKGMYLMTDGWFDKYNYQVVVERKYVPAKILHVWDNAEPIMLDPWTPHI